MPRTGGRATCHELPVPGLTVGDRVHGQLGAGAGELLEYAS